MSIDEINLDTLADSVVALLPAFTRLEQELALRLYHLLSAGRPVRREQLAESLGLPTREVVQMLERWPSLVYYDDYQRVIGFGGLTILPMTHRLDVGGRSLYTWCAWDSLFIPELLGETARVGSSCPETGDSIRLTVTSQGVSDAEPPDTVVSFLLPDVVEMRENVVANFCHYVFFLRTADAGAKWTARHDGTFLLSLGEAFELGKRKNAAQFATPRSTIASPHLCRTSAPRA